MDHQEDSQEYSQAYTCEGYGLFFKSSHHNNSNCFIVIKSGVHSTIIAVPSHSPGRRDQDAKCIEEKKEAITYHKIESRVDKARLIMKSLTCWTP